MQNIFYFHAMKRSGHHCILYWIKSAYTNAHRVNNHTLGAPVKKVKEQNIFVNFEDCIIRQGNLISNEANFNIKNTFLVLRDPFNLFASRLTRKWSMNKLNYPIDEQKNLWLNHADNFLHNKNIIAINYNKWFCSNEYKNDLKEKLEIEPESYFLNYIPAVGRGSSFDRRKVKGRKMNVMKRWEQLEKDIFDNIYKKVFTNEVIQLTITIFGKDFVNSILESERWNRK